MAFSKSPDEPRRSTGRISETAVATSLTSLPISDVIPFEPMVGAALGPANRDHLRTVGNQLSRGHQHPLGSVDHFFPIREPNYYPLNLSLDEPNIGLILVAPT